jgi:hypothetical protein
MEKILLVIDGLNLDIPTLDFACYLGRLTKSKITGVFLENLVADERPVLVPMYGLPSVEWGIDKDSPRIMEKRELIDKNISLFKQACENRSINYSIHRDRGEPAKEIISESRYADVIVLDAATSFNKRFEGTPTDFVRDVLGKTECPVIVAPESFDVIDEIIFTYNSSKSSAFAIKQFSYIFPQFEDKRIILLTVNKNGEWEDKDKHNLREWLQNRYSSIGFVALKGDTDDCLFDYMLKRKNIFIVMGAYGRTPVSNFFNRSHADRLIKTITQPIFISHF